MIYKLSQKISIIVFLFLLSGFSQDSESLSSKYYFTGFNFGRSYIQDIFSNKSILNIGIFLSMQDWPHLYRVYYNRSFEVVFDQSTITKGFISRVSEFNITYNYLLQFPILTKLYFSMGSGIGFFEAKQNIAYIGEESAKTKTFIKMGFPVEIRIGFLYPNKKMRLLNFIYFFNFNSFNNFDGWKLNFNISLN